MTSPPRLRPAPRRVTAFSAALAVACAGLAGCERLLGAQLGRGAYAMEARGALTGRYEGPAAYARSATLGGGRGDYTVDLGLPGRSVHAPEALYLSARRPLRPATYAVARPPADFQQWPAWQPPDGAVDAAFLRPGRGTEGSDRYYAGDSGVVRLMRCRAGLAGAFRVFLSDRASAAPGDSAGRLELSGTFELHWEGPPMARGGRPPAPRVCRFPTVDGPASGG